MIRTVVHYSDSATFGGTERAILRLVAAMDRRHWKAVLLHHADAPEALVTGAHRIDMATRLVQRVKGKLHVGTLAALSSEIRGNQASVFHAHLPWPLACKYGIAAAAAARVPAIVATAQLHVELSRTGFVDLQHRMMTQLVRRYIAVSRHVADELVRRFRVPAAKIVVIPNAVDEAEIDDGLSHPAPDWPVTARQKTALVLARLEVDKGVDVAIDAIATLPDVHLVIAGTGSCQTDLETRATQLGVSDRVHFVGQRDDPAALLARADVFVLPSFVEGLPLSVLEAMAARVAVVATDIGGTREAVENERTGLLVPPRDAAALARAIHRVLTEPDAASLRRDAARDRVRAEFSVTTIASRVTALYGSLLPADA